MGFNYVVSFEGFILKVWFWSLTFFFFFVLWDSKSHQRIKRLSIWFQVLFCILFELWTWIHEICNKFYFEKKKFTRRHNILKREYFIINYLLFFKCQVVIENTFFGERVLPHSYVLAKSSLETCHHLSWREVPMD